MFLGNYLGGCAAQLAAYAACSACQCASREVLRHSARVAWSVLFFLAMVAAWVLRDFATPLLQKIPWIVKADVVDVDKWFGQQAVYRVSMGNFRQALLTAEEGGAADTSAGLDGVPDVAEATREAVTGGAPKPKADLTPVSYNYSFFHLIFALASMYIAMLMTGWGSVAQFPARYLEGAAGCAGGSVPANICSPPATLLATAWRRVLTRGARPRKLELRLRGLEASACEGFGLRLLEALGAAVPPLALTDVTLLGVPLTAAVVRAIAAAAPQLSVLTLSGYDLSLCTGLRGSLPFGSGLRGSQILLRHAAPHLTELSLEDLGTSAGASWLPLMLQRCPRLASLSLGVSTPSEALVEALPRLSQLTELSLYTYSNAALPAVAQLRGLVKLVLSCCTLQPEGLQLLAGLTALKQLRVETFQLPDSLDPAVPPQPNTLPLPPLLESLTFSEDIHPTALVALRLPASLTELVMRNAIAIDRDDDLDLDGRLRPAAAAALVMACGQLQGRTGCASLALGWSMPPPTWPNRYGTLYDALRQAAIRRLDLQYVTLRAADVAALVRHLPALEVLFLKCHAPPCTWPLLCRLERLRVLRLHPGMGQSVAYWEEFCDEQAMRAALLALCVEAPALECLELALLLRAVDDVNTGPFAVRARAQCKVAVTWLEEALPRLRASPPKLVCDEFWEDESSSWASLEDC
ncbi:hypothetical protein TSOC_003432 [Tetrabaena socialis]|uniref:Uncharacterized protein n=1 Tax=Tetrabaena socialis TaxID=47790 RepID=A0A2J8ABL6_9CHLO|nr:hypothetical protein TSOC_003432 [Tetrabaena socialis]|eukprot:PNH09910.1 hypothetical protein TSOC_003432 [Tetrabaena socialis]